MKIVPIVVDVVMSTDRATSPTDVHTTCSVTDTQNSPHRHRARNGNRHSQATPPGRNKYLAQCMCRGWMPGRR
eukprot:scaffold761_cov282-Prasinococcus_capsulatus_cf.AAC.1